MRQIKFRAWSTCGKYLDVVCEIFWSVGGLRASGAGVNFCGCRDWDKRDLVDDHIIIEQFTGLLDKNGKEIYEGDIVKYQDYNTTDRTWKVANVYWMDGADWAKVPFLHPFGCPVSGKDEQDGRSVNVCYVTPPNACEVIGNTHSNPELLK